MSANELSALIYKKHKIKVDDDDPIMVMLTISEFMMQEERQAFKNALKVIEQQSKAQLSEGDIKRLITVVNRKAKPNFQAYLLGGATAAIVALIIALTATLWYEPSRLGNRLIDAYPKMDKATQEAVKKAMQ